jgi:hypothetical protein
MNEITTTRSAAIPTLPKLSRDLELYLMPPSWNGLAPVPPTSEMIEEARGAVMASWALRDPVTRKTIRQWLATINTAVRNTQPDEEFMKRVSAIAVACTDLPGWVFNADTLREAMRAWQFWPAVADVHALLDAHAAPVLARLDALQAVASHEAAPTPSPAPAEPELTPEQRAEATRRMRETIASAGLSTPALRPVRTAPVLSRATLNAIYAADGLSGPVVPE